MALSKAYWYSKRGTDELAVNMISIKSSTASCRLQDQLVDKNKRGSLEMTYFRCKLGHPGKLQAQLGNAYPPV